jgi:hypothetical protein
MQIPKNHSTICHDGAHQRKWRKDTRWCQEHNINKIAAAVISTRVTSRRKGINAIQMYQSTIVLKQLLQYSDVL